MTTKEQYTLWDVANYLQTEEDILLYLEAASEEDPGDGSIIRMALRDVTRALNMSGLARSVGISRAGLYKTLSPDGNPSFSTIMRLTRALGVQVILRPLPTKQPADVEEPEHAKSESPTPTIG